MSYLTVNGVDAVEGRISLPRLGAWTADVVLVDGIAPGAAALAIAAKDGSSVNLQGTVVRLDAINGTLRARIVGGAGGLGTQLQAQGYYQVGLSIVLKDALRGAGEALSPTAEAATLAVNLPAWTRAAGPAGAVVQTLAELTGTTWRVLQDGTIWIGHETWPTVTPDYQLLDKMPELGTWDVFMDPPTLVPGTTFAGGRVSYVEHYFSDRKLRTQVTFEDANASNASLDRTKANLQRVLLQLLGRRLEYFPLYPATAVSQNGDGTLEVQPDNANIGQLSHVPIRTGVPGVTAKVHAGARVLIGHAEGDPSKAIATLWESATVSELVAAAAVVKLGGAGASHPLIFGDDFSSATGNFATLVKAIATAVGAIPTGGAAAATAINGALTVYLANVLAVLSSNKTT